MFAYAVLASFCAGLVSATVCPGGGLCPGRNTCCLTKEGYGCCNDPFAVCCSDQLHCCPAGYHCSSAAQSCVKDGLPWYRLAWLKHTPAQEPESTLLKHSVPEFDSSAIQETTSDAGGVVKCDNTYSCSDSATCCIGRSGNWSCCGHKHGRCCRDGIHCCPFGYYCNRASTKCLKGDLSIDATPQLPAVRSDEDQFDRRAIQERPSAVFKVMCDEDYYCRNGQTCCLGPAGTWTCCRYSRGHCCRDGYHCCASGYICDHSSYKCLKGYLRIDASPQLPALKYDDYQQGDVAAPVPWATLEELAPGDGGVALTTQVIRCVGRLYCPDGNSCCQSPTGEWGCCPHLQGQCCQDGKHCCEYKWNCDETSTKCVNGDTDIPSSIMREIQLL